jgi:hypothetical protein
MAGNTEIDGTRGGSRWRIAAWATAAILLLLPLIAIQFTDEVNWDETDFAVGFHARGNKKSRAWSYDRVRPRRINSGLSRAPLGPSLPLRFRLLERPFMRRSFCRKSVSAQSPQLPSKKGMIGIAPNIPETNGDIKGYFCLLCGIKSTSTFISEVNYWS